MRKGLWRGRLSVLAVSLGGASVLPISACDGMLGTEFRTAASDSIKTGVQSIVSGLIDGVFAVVEPDAQNNKQ